jgi:hypothetical protein
MVSAPLTNMWTTGGSVAVTRKNDASEVADMAVGAPTALPGGVPALAEEYGMAVRSGSTRPFGTEAARMLPSRR